MEAEWPGEYCICQQSRFLAAIPVQRLLLPCSPGNYPLHKYPTASVLFVHLTLPDYLLLFFLPHFPLYLFPLFVLSSFLFELNLFYLLSGGGRLFKLRLPYSRGITRWDVLGQWYFIHQHY